MLIACNTTRSRERQRRESESVSCANCSRQIALFEYWFHLHWALIGMQMAKQNAKANKAKQNNISKCRRWNSNDDCRCLGPLYLGLEGRHSYRRWRLPHPHRRRESGVGVDVVKLQQLWSKAATLASQLKINEASYKRGPETTNVWPKKRQLNVAHKKKVWSTQCICCSFACICCRFCCFCVFIVQFYCLPFGRSSLDFCCAFCSRAFDTSSQMLPAVQTVCCRSRCRCHCQTPTQSTSTFTKETVAKNK